MVVYVLSYDWGHRFVDGEKVGTYQWVRTSQAQNPDGLFEIPSHNKDDVVEYTLPGTMQSRQFKYVGGGLYRELSTKERNEITHIRRAAASALQSENLDEQRDQEDSGIS